MSINTIILDGITVHIENRLSLNQSYQVLGGSSTFRTGGGKLKKQTYWEALGISISGSGTLPSPFMNLDKNKTMILDCIQPMSDQTENTVFTIPRIIREDITPYVLAFNGDTIVEVDSTFSLGKVNIDRSGGLSDYTVYYYPRMSVIIIDMDEDVDANGKVYSWNIQLEEELPV